jgi:hypothetical protein
MSFSLRLSTARRTQRPMRPKPLIAILVAIVRQSP